MTKLQIISKLWSAIYDIKLTKADFNMKCFLRGGNNMEKIRAEPN